MKAIIAGGRDYEFTDEDIAKLDRLNEDHVITEVVNGGAKGADADGEVWAKANGIPVRRFHAQWGDHGRAAGPIRNRKMAQYADMLIAFPGGRGTRDMVKQAKAADLEVHIIADGAALPEQLELFDT